MNKEIMVENIDSVEIIGITQDRFITGDTIRRVYLEENYVCIGTYNSYEVYNLNNMKGFKVNYR